MKVLVTETHLIEVDTDDPKIAEDIARIKVSQGYHGLKKGILLDKSNFVRFSVKAELTEDQTCDNCAYSELAPCPHLMNVSCGAAQGYLKFVQKKEKPEKPKPREGLCLKENLSFKGLQKLKRKIGMKKENGRTTEWQQNYLQFKNV